MTSPSNRNKLSKFQLLDLFSGIGGFSLGLERSGYFETAAFCEIEDYPRRVLAKHWPGRPIYGDVRELTRERLVRDGISAIDVVCGGFPCQDASVANSSGLGSSGPRTGLFREGIRLVREVGARYVLMENVPELFNRGFGDVLGALAEIGFNVEWECFRASDLGFNHERERLYILGYAAGERLQGFEQDRRILISAKETCAKYGDRSAGARLALVDDSHSLRNADGVSLTMERHRIKALGNAVIPHIVEAIGRAIGEWEKMNRDQSV